MSESNKTYCTAPGKVAVEIKAEAFADRGYKMLGAPYFCHERQTWVHELEKPKEANK